MNMDKENFFSCVTEVVWRGESPVREIFENYISGFNSPLFEMRAAGEAYPPKI